MITETDIIQRISSLPPKVPLKEVAQLSAIQQETLNLWARKGVIRREGGKGKAVIPREDVIPLIMGNIDQILGWKNVYEVSEQLGVEHKTLSKWCSEKRIESARNIFGHHVISPDAITALSCRANREKDKWEKLADVGRKFGVKEAILHEWCRKKKICSYMDLNGRYRIHPAEMEKIAHWAKLRSFGDVMFMDGQNYYSLAKLARDYVLKMKVDPKSKSFKEKVKAKYSAFHHMITSSTTFTHKKVGVFGNRIYIPESVYVVILNMIPVSQVAKYCGVNRHAVYFWGKSGKIKLCHVEGADRFVLRPDFDEFLAKHPAYQNKAIWENGYV